MPALVPIVLGILGVAARLLAPLLFGLVFRVLGESVKHLVGGRTSTDGTPATLRTILLGGAAGGRVAASRNDPASRLAALQQLHADGRLTDQRLAQLTAAIENERGR